MYVSALVALFLVLDDSLHQGKSCDFFPTSLLIPRTVLSLVSLEQRTPNSLPLPQPSQLSAICCCDQCTPVDDSGSQSERCTPDQPTNERQALRAPGGCFWWARGGRGSPISLATHHLLSRVMPESKNCWTSPPIFGSKLCSSTIHPLQRKIMQQTHSSDGIFNQSFLCTVQPICVFLSFLPKCKYLFLLITQMSKYTKSTHFSAFLWLSEDGLPAHHNIEICFPSVQYFYQVLK